MHFRLQTVVCAVVAAAAVLSGCRETDRPREVAGSSESGSELRYRTVMMGPGAKASASEVRELANRRDGAIQVIVERLKGIGFRLFEVLPSGDDEIVVRLQGLSETEVPRIDAVVKQAGVLEFRVVVNDDKYKVLLPEEIARRGIKRYMMTQQSKHPDEPDQEFALWVQTIDTFDLTGKDLAGVRPGRDAFGGLAVNFEFNERGAGVFERMTRMLAQKGRIAVILNGRLNSAPFVESVIRQRGQITGDFTEQEVEDLVAVLRAGSLPVELELISSKPFNAVDGRASR